MTDKLREMFFSQAALTAYQACPLKFRYRYLEDLGWIHAGQNEDWQTERLLGEQFHLLAQRYFQRVDLAALRQAVPPGPLTAWFKNLEQHFPLESSVAYYPEQEIRISNGGMKLIAKYDLLAVYPDGRVVIYDWKTPAKRLSKTLRTLQGKIYPMVLCAAAPFGPPQPELITMVFWNPRFPDEEQLWTYHERLYREDRDEISAMIAAILRKPYRDFYGIKPEDGSLPPKGCGYCEYKLLCYGIDGQKAGFSTVVEPDRVFSWEDIEEISYEEA